MNKYELIFESLQEYLDNGEITLEEAEVLNDYAYDRYIEEKTALQKRVEDDDKYDELRRYLGDKIDNEKDYNKLNRLSEINYSILAKRARSDNGRIISAKKKLDLDIEKDKKNAKIDKVAYDIKPHKERKPNTYYNMQKNKNKFNELVKKYNYDPKSKTVEIDGTRTPIRYKHDDGSSDYYSQNRRGVHDVKVQKKDYKKYKKSFVSDNYKGITIRKHALDDDKFNFTVNHENQHAKDASLKRMIEREPRFDTKHGTKVFDKDTRRKIVELKREIRNSKNSDDLDVLINRINKRQELEDLINVSKKKTEEYKTDKNEKRKDKREEFSKKVREYLMHDSSSSNLVKKLNVHDADGGEIYADLGAMKHGKNKEYTMKNQRKTEESMKKYGIGSKEAHNSNVARRETRNDLKKRGLMNYVESFNE